MKCVPFFIDCGYCHILPATGIDHIDNKVATHKYAKTKVYMKLHSGFFDKFSPFLHK